MAERNEEFANDNKVVVDIRRVSKATTGGSDLSFSAVVIVGDRNGRVGIGRGSAKEVQAAIAQAEANGQKNMVSIKLKNGTIYHSIKQKFCATRVEMHPAAPGSGIKAGGAMRAIFEMLGIENITAKVIGSTNPLNVSRATLKALTSLQDPLVISERRGKPLKHLLRLPEKTKEAS